MILTERIKDQKQKQPNLSLGLKLTSLSFLPSFPLDSCHPAERRLFCEWCWTAWQIQSREGGVPLGPQQWLGWLRAQRQWPEVSCGGERNWGSLGFLLLDAVSLPQSFCRLNGHSPRSSPETLCGEHSKEPPTSLFFAQEETHKAPTSTLTFASSVMPAIHSL